MGGFSASKFDSQWDIARADDDDGDVQQQSPPQDHLPHPRRVTGSRQARGLSRTFLQELMHTWTNEDPFRHGSVRTLPSIPEHEAEAEVSDGLEDVVLDDDEEEGRPTTALEVEQDGATPDSSSNLFMAFGSSRPHRGTLTSTPPNGSRSAIVGRMRPRSMPPSSKIRDDGIGRRSSSLSVRSEYTYG